MYVYKNIEEISRRKTSSYIHSPNVKKQNKKKNGDIILEMHKKKKENSSEMSRVHK